MAHGILILIYDGLGDRPVEELDGRTSLEAADTPNLDTLASRGINGIMDTIAPGIVPGSDTGHLALLGYDPYEVYTGRGPFEVAGLGIDVEPGHVAFRCNFSTIVHGKITDRRAGRIKEGTEELSEALNDIDIGIDFVFEPSVEHRCVLIFKEKDLGSGVSDVDPHADSVPYKKAEPTSDRSEDARTAELLNEFVAKSIEVLSEHPVNQQRVKDGKPPANIILPRGAGSVPSVRSLPERTGMKCAAIAGIPLVRGVCVMAGMDIIDVQGATGGLDTDIEAIYESSRAALNEYDLVLVNIKGPDLPGHDGLPQQKIEFIQKLDAYLDILDLPDAHIAITGDHSTPVTVKDHSGDPLPLTIIGPGVRTDDVTEYSERSCAKGGLSRIRGQDLLNILMDLSGKAEKFGA